MQHIKIKPELLEGHARWPSQTGEKTATGWARLATLSSWYKLTKKALNSFNFYHILEFLAKSRYQNCQEKGLGKSSNITFTEIVSMNHL